MTDSEMNEGNTDMTGKRSVAERCSAVANEYDRSKEAQGWRGPEVVFGLMYAFLLPGQSVLDIGIGTGLSSQLFHKAGLSVYGMDMSSDMLDVCREKHIAKDVKVHDLTIDPYPYATASFHHAVCVGVLNHFEDLKPVFRETSRILKCNGVFGFVVADRNPEEQASFNVQHADAQITMFRHSKDQIHTLLDRTSFEFLTEIAFSVHGHEGHGQPMSLKAYTVRRTERIEPAGA